MKKLLWMMAVLACVCSLAGCRREEVIRADIFSLAERNYDAIAQACEERDEAALYAIKGIEQVDLVEGYVIIHCGSGGIAPSSQYYGFYYSEENLPVAVFGREIVCNTDDLTEKGAGYQYYDSGCNSFYTEHIKGKLYFYSASF